MAISTRLVMRQGQSLVMTPQLLQAIKLLQLSNLELINFVEQELERNPLLERSDDAPAALEDQPISEKASEDSAGSDDFDDPGAEASEGDWASERLETSQASMEENLGTEVENTFDSDKTVPVSTSPGDDAQYTVSAGSMAGSSAGSD